MGTSNFWSFADQDLCNELSVTPTRFHSKEVGGSDVKMPASLVNEQIPACEGVFRNASVDSPFLLSLF